MMKRLLSRTPNVVLLLLLLLGITFSSQVLDASIASAATAKLAFTTAPQTIVAGNVSGMILLQTQDTSNSPYYVTADTTINLTSSSANGIFYSDAAGLNPITTVKINAGSSSASFYYKDTKAGSSTITAAESPSQGWTAAKQVETVKVAALDHFSFGTIGNQTENTTFSISITAQDAYGNTVTSYTGTNNLTDTTGTISPTTTGAFTGGSWTGDVTIASVQNGVTITTSGGGKTGVSNAFDTVAAGAIAKLAFTTAPQTIAAGNVSGRITLQTQDASSNPYNVTADTTINLTSSSANGIFYSDAAGSNPITTVKINAGSSSASFYYKDTKAGSLTITAAESPSQGWTAATQHETINPAVPPAGTTSKGIPLYLIIVIGASVIVLGLVGYLVSSRIRRKAKRDKREMKPPLTSTATQRTAQMAGAMRKEMLEATRRTAQMAGATRKEQVPEVTQKTAEVAEATKQEQVPEVTQGTAEMAGATKQGPTSDLLSEIETNLRIATTQVKDSLIAFQTQVWDSKRDEVPSLPASVKEELTNAYSIMSLANTIVRLSSDTGRRSPNLDDNYAKLCKRIADQLDKVRQLLEQS